RKTAATKWGRISRPILESVALGQFFRQMSRYPVPHSLEGKNVIKKFSLAAALVAAFAASTCTFAADQTPRHGGTLRYVAPYGATFANMDIHTSNRAQDEIYAKAIHRSLYIWDSNQNKA